MVKACVCGDIEQQHRGGTGVCEGCACAGFSYDRHCGLVIIYHGGCPDGFGAAYAVWLKFGDMARYVPARHGSSPPEVLRGDKVYICDFSYPRKDILGLADRVGVKEWGGKLIILDHHKSAMEALGDLEFAHFDMARSGAVITWEHFHPGEEIPRILLYVQDHDLWTNKLPGIREFSAGLQSYPQEFELWDGLGIDDLIAEGKSIIRYIDLQVAHLVQQDPTYVVMGNYWVPVINGPAAWASEICQALLSDVYPVAACRQQVVGGWAWELRSLDDHDVSVLAQEFGGGGHKNAAGFRTKDEGKNPKQVLGYRE